MAKKDNEKTEKQFFGEIDEILIDENGELYTPNSRSRSNDAETQDQSSNEQVENKEENVVDEVEKVEEVEETEVAEEVDETTEDEEVSEEVDEAEETEDSEEEDEAEVVDEAEAVEETENADDQELNEGAVVAAITDSVEERQKFVAKTFAQKMIEADSVIQDRYDELKNYACRFKKLKSRISRKFDSVNQGRLQFVKLTVAGKTLKLFLNMDIANVDSKFHCKDMSDKKTYVTVPVLLRIKSGRAVKYAKILIDRCAEQHGLVENKKYQEVDAISLIEEFIASKNNDVESEVAVSEE